jgi:hypothetical protein
MAILKLHGSKEEINNIILGEIPMPNYNSILKKEKIQVFAYVESTIDLNNALNDPNEPLNIRFRMDQVEEKIPNYKIISEFDAMERSCRSLSIGEGFKSNNPIQINITTSNEKDIVLSGRYKKNFMNECHIEGNWNSIFTKFENLESSKYLLPKSNTLVINDNYLFNNSTKTGENLGILNLVSLLDAILPSNSIEEYHILVITSDCKWSPEFARKNFDYILNELKVKFEYPIFFELVIWEKPNSTRHKRMLISNYYTSIVDRGFGIFNLQNDVVGPNDIVVESIFHDALEPGDSPYETSNIYLQLFSSAYKSAKDYCRKQKPTVGRIYLCNCEKMDKVNRLLEGKL